MRSAASSCKESFLLKIRKKSDKIQIIKIVYKVQKMEGFYALTGIGKN